MANLRTNNLSGEGGRNAIRGSVYFDGYLEDDTPTSYLSVPDSDDLDMGTGDFTFECWLLAIKHEGTNNPNFMGIFSSNSFTAGGFLIQVNNTGPLRLVIPLAAGGNFEESAGPELWGDGTSSNRSWNHIAVTRVSGTIKGYVNGIEVISASHNVGVDFAHGGSANIGENSYSTYAGDYPLRGYISNLRVCKGHAVYTGNFTPPTSQLTSHYISENDKTVLLCCQDPDNPLQEATGKTLTGYGRHPSQAYDENGEGPELVTSTGVWTLTKGGSGSSNFTVTKNGQKLSATTVTSGYVRANFTGLNEASKYRIKVTLVAGSNNNFGVQGYDKDGNTVTHYFPATDGTAGSALQVGPTYVFEATGIGQWQLTGSAWNTLYTFDDISIKQIPNEVPLKETPPFGVDAGNTFDGAISMNSSAWMYFPTGRTEERGRGRGIFAGGDSPRTNAITFIQIQSEGDSLDFGDLPTGRLGMGGVGSSTRGVMASGYTSSNVNSIDFITIANTSNSVDFGDNTQERHEMGSSSNETRGIFGGGTAPSLTNIIDYVTIASRGNAVNFGDLTVVRRNVQGVSSPTRSVFAGGRDPSGNGLDTIDYVTIASTGDATDFGNLTAGRGRFGSVCSETRGVFCGGETPSAVNTIDFITIASTGDATDFGDTSTTVSGGPIGGASNKIRGVFDSPYVSPAYINTMEYVTIATAGNSTNFGDQTIKGTRAAGFSDSHGGL